jgi:hypothetical protein
MAGRHRRISSQSQKLAVVGVATATATALTVGAASPSPKPVPAPIVTHKDVDLAAAFRPFTDPGRIPDLTGGLGTAAYNVSQQIADTLLRLLVDHVNLSALASAAGVNLVNLPNLLQQIPTSLLSGVLGAIPINITGALGDTLSETLGPITSGLLTPLLIQALGALGITDASGNTTIINLLGLLGLDLSDPLNLANLDIPGVKLITAGPPFTLLKLLGLDLGWVPGLPNSVADAINSTPYLDIGLKGLLNTVIGKLDDAGNPLGLGGLLGNIVNTLPIDVDLAALRVPIVAGFGLGAFAAGAAYQQVVADLPNQPGGTNYTGTAPALGSFTILPMVLLRNPGRANGGLFARLFPLAGLFGIDTVTPDTQATSSGGIPILNTGLSLGGANLVPVKIDATVEYDLLSDFAAWPDPLSIANSLMGTLLPTYLLRGIDTSNLTPQLTSQIEQALANATNLNQPLALNLYLTLPTNSLPLLEPLYLAADVENLATFGALPNVFEKLANALAPALTSLVNLGYTDVVRNPDGTYTRTLDDAGVPTPFLSFPDVNWGQVPGDVINSLINGFKKEFFSSNPTPGTPNAVTGLLKLLTGVLNPLGGLGSILGGLNLTQAVTQQVSTLAANEIPSADAKAVTLSTDTAGDTSTTPKHAAADTGSTTSTTSSSTTTKPASPKSPVGEVLGGATQAAAGVVGAVTHDVTGGIAGALKGLTAKKSTATTAKTATTPKTDSAKDSTDSASGGATHKAPKHAA